MKLTDWYSGDQKPVRVGVYQRKKSSGFFPYSYWNGEKWALFCTRRQQAWLCRYEESFHQSLPWRGIAK